MKIAVRSLVALLYGAVLAACASSPGGSSYAPAMRHETASGPKFDVFSLIRTSSGITFKYPYGLTVDGDDNAWFSCWVNCGGYFARVTPAGKVDLFSAYAPENFFLRYYAKYRDEPALVDYGPGGDLWFTDQSDPRSGSAPAAIGRIDLAGPLSAQAFQGSAFPGNGVIAATASNRDVYWVLAGCSNIRRENCRSLYAFDGTSMQRYTVRYTKKRTAAGGLVTGHRGDLWLSWGVPGSYESYVTHITPPSDFQTYRLPDRTETGWPAVAADGSLWYQAIGRYCGVYDRGKWSGIVGRVLPDGRVREYCLPNEVAVGIESAAMANGAYWFTNHTKKARYLGRISASGSVTQYPLPKSMKNPVAMVAGSKRDLWIGDLYDNSAVHVRLP